VSRVPVRYLSPLRYPGGKGRLANFVADLLSSQAPRPFRYVEPFAGGAGVGLKLLIDEYVDEIVLNDLNPGIAAFWRAVFSQSAELIGAIKTCQLSIDEWHRQRDIYESPRANDFDRGFATFFLNRTNRSGILDARPIGGLDQRGRWKIDARFDKQSLSQRIQRLSRYASRVTVCEQDGIDLVETHLGNKDTFVYADPPYLAQGEDLYLDTLTWNDHQRLASLLRRSSSWLLTYDADPRITDELYTGLRCARFQTSHTAAIQHIGQEYAVFASSLRISSLEGLGSGTAQMIPLTLIHR